MREYEAMIITRADLPESDLQKMVAKWEDILLTNGGQVLHKDASGAKRLAYPIEKQTKGCYFLYNVATPSANVKELDRVLGLDENVLRQLFIKVSDNVTDFDARKKQIKEAIEANKNERKSNMD